MREFFGEVPVILVKMADYINPLTFESEVPEGWRKIQELQERAPEYISNVRVVTAPTPEPVYELHPQNKSGLGKDVAKVSVELSKYPGVIRVAQILAFYVIRVLTYRR